MIILAGIQRRAPEDPILPFGLHFSAAIADEFCRHRGTDCRLQGFPSAIGSISEVLDVAIDRHTGEPAMPDASSAMPHDG